MIKYILFLMLGCVVIALLGALGESMMRYGRREGIVKDNYGEGEGEMKTPEKIKVLIKHVGEKPYFCNVDNTLEALQKTIGGYIETVRLAEDMVIICDEEGIINNSRYNTTICGAQFFGTILICGVQGEEFADLPVSEDTVRRLFCGMFAEKERSKERDGQA